MPVGIATADVTTGQTKIVTARVPGTSDRIPEGQRQTPPATTAQAAVPSFATTNPSANPASAQPAAKTETINLFIRCLLIECPNVL